MDEKGGDLVIPRQIGIKVLEIFFIGFLSGGPIKEVLIIGDSWVSPKIKILLGKK